MSRHEVKILYRRSEKNDSEIEYIGGLNKSGTDWKIDVDRAISGIESGKWEFYIIKNDLQLDLKILYNNFKKEIIVDVSNINFFHLNEILL